MDCFGRANNAAEKNNEATAREKLELVLMQLVSDKYTDKSYNPNEYVDNRLSENGMLVADENIVIVDSWKFEIDREKLQIVNSFGKGTESQEIQIESSVEYNEELSQATITYTIIYDGNLKTIVSNRQNIEIPEKKEGKYIIKINVDKNGTYRIQVTDSDDSYKLGSAVVEGLVTNLTSNSLIEIAEDISTTSQMNLNINNEVYSANCIVYNGNLVLDGSIQVPGSVLNNNVYEFGDKSKDVAKENEYAKNMVILKVKGNLTINEGVTLAACKSDNGYGGPKGLFVYCTGTITNYGTISMTGRGAYAQGQNVYLFKNASGAYEYVPAVGGTGGSAINVQRTTKDGSHEDGKDGESVEKNSRQTGGGGSGKVYSYTNYTHYEVKSGKGGNGTSYSGGSGGGSNNAYDRINDITMNGDEKGGIGGKSYIYTTGFPIAGGVGNPGGLSFGSQEVTRGKNGTGGLLIISANSINNTGKIEANGVGNGRQDAGGSSGGGSINIFYKEEFTNTDENNITAKGGISTNYATYGKAGDGGNGSVTIGSIASGTFVEK